MCHEFYVILDFIFWIGLFVLKMIDDDEDMEIDTIEEKAGERIKKMCYYNILGMNGRVEEEMWFS